MRKFLKKFEIGYGVEILTYLEEENGKKYFQWDTYFDNKEIEYNEILISQLSEGNFNINRITTKCPLFFIFIL